MIFFVFEFLTNGFLNKERLNKYIDEKNNDIKFQQSILVEIEQLNEADYNKNLSHEKIINFIYKYIFKFFEHLNSFQNDLNKLNPITQENKENYCKDEVKYF